MRSRIVWVGVGVALAILVLSAPAARGAVVGYQATAETSGDGFSKLYSIDVTTGVRGLIGSTGVQCLRALDSSPHDGFLYGLGYGSVAGTSLFRIDTATGSATEVVTGVAPGGFVVNNLAFAPNGIAYASVGWLYDDPVNLDLLKIDVLNKTVTHLGSLSPVYDQMRALAIDAAGNGIGWDADSNSLFTVDLNTAATTHLGDLNLRFEAFDYGPDGTLYGWSIWDEIYAIDPASATATLMPGLTNTPHSIGSLAIAFPPVPEPTSLLVWLLLGVLGIAVGWRPRR